MELKHTNSPRNARQGLSKGNEGVTVIIDLLYHSPRREAGGFTFVSLQHVFVRLGIGLFLGMVRGQQTRHEPSHGGSPGG